MSKKLKLVTYKGKPVDEDLYKEILERQEVPEETSLLDHMFSALSRHELFAEIDEQTITGALFTLGTTNGDITVEIL